ncbi:Kv channel-interacting protein 4-like isoform X2 [Pollicipes pollicipes]|uniref:Kv channel-interacting protein 4-like isoform X2 n=1 Tax=Pollicipes pollicipes TaxID=41117 RepID=UPI001884E8D5|nr:Kv channel-interacting protein 4-like isoform X2 [Pollicipes pollicipes]
MARFLRRSLRRKKGAVRFGNTELDEFEPNALRYKPDHIETLCKSTKFSKKEIQLMYRGFKQECPSGTVNEETFKYIYSRFFPQGDSNAYAHHIFNTFDTDHTGTINFEEFVTALSALSRGDIYDKLRWAFSLYDVNGDGYITKEEMLDVVGSVYMLVGRRASPTGEDTTTKQHVDRIFQRMDINGDGVVTLEEFVELCSNDETIAQSLNLLDTCF